MSRTGPEQTENNGNKESRASGTETGNRAGRTHVHERIPLT